MAKLQYGRNHQVSFGDLHEYYLALGFLADAKHAEIKWEHNEDQGAWGSEGRIHCLVPTSQFPHNFAFSAGRGNQIYARINCNEYVATLVKEHKFIANSRQQNVADIMSTVPDSYLDDFRMGYGKPIKAAIHAANPFTEWLEQNTQLSESSISKYSGAVSTISKDMATAGIIAKPFFNMNAYELDVAIEKVLKNGLFSEKNLRGNHMYSNALKQYRLFINSTCAIEESHSVLESIQNDVTIPETERKSIVQSRIGQGSFRKALLDKYHSTCLITGINIPQLLVASHIKPWAVSSNVERLSVENGLLLSATYDRLFDSGLITFSKTGKIYISSIVSEENMERLHLAKGIQYDLQASNAMGEYLDYHSDFVFVK